VKPVVPGAATAPVAPATPPVQPVAAPAVSGFPAPPAPPPVASGYSYPVVATASVPGAHHKLSHTQLLLAAGGIIAVIVVVLTVVLVAAKPGVTPCHFSCGPKTGPRLTNPDAYTSSQFNFRVEYDKGSLGIGTQNAASVTLQNQDGSAVVQITGSSGSNVSGAIQSAISGLDTNTFQNVQQLGTLNGAEIGLVQGQGAVYSAQVSGGGQAIPIVIIVMSASQNNVTITTVAFGPQDQQSNPQDTPYGMSAGTLLDGPVTNTIWPGSQ